MSATLPKFTLPSLNHIVKDGSGSSSVNGGSEGGMAVNGETSDAVEPGLGSQHVTLAEFMDTGGGIMDAKTEKIMQVCAFQNVLHSISVCQYVKMTLLCKGKKE